MASLANRKRCRKTALVCVIVLTVLHNMGIMYRPGLVPPGPPDREKTSAIEWIQKWRDQVGNFSFVRDKMSYFIYLEKLVCLEEGTDMSATVNLTKSACVCLPKWFGEHCSIPLVVSAANPQYHNFSIRRKPRNIIQSLLFLNEYAMLDYRLHATGDLVDAFIIQDSIYSGFGDPKNLTAIPYLLSNSVPSHLRRKIVPKVMLTYPDGADRNGFEYDTTMRNFAFSNGIPPELCDVSDDDIFMYTDADEVPSREVLLFLKVHNNIPEPISLSFRINIYGFFWYHRNVIAQVASTFGMMKEVFHLSPNFVRGGYFQKHRYRAMEYVRNRQGAVFGPLVLGTDEVPAGYHCSWCAHPDGIRTKLLSAQNADLPRWGDYPWKCDISYIKSLIARGMWFGENDCYTPAPHTHPLYAPKYILQHNVTYRYLLHNQYRTNSTKCEPLQHATTGLVVKGWHRIIQTKLKH